MSDKEFPQMDGFPDLSKMQTGMIAMFELFRAMTDAGFTEPQALTFLAEFTMRNARSQ